MFLCICPKCEKKFSLVSEQLDHSRDYYIDYVTITCPFCAYEEDVEESNFQKNEIK